MLHGTNYRSLGFQSAEHLSADVSFRVLVAYGYRVEDAHRVSCDILATNPLVSPKTLEQKILRASDFMGLGGSFDDYMNDFEKLRLETGADDEFEFFRAGLSAIARYFAGSIRLTPEYYSGGTSSWHLGVAGNLIKNYHRICYQQSRESFVICEPGTGVRPLVLLEDTGGSLVIGLEPESGLRHSAVEMQIARKLPFVELIAPGTGAAIPVPNDSVDRVHFNNVALRHPETLCKSELLRIMKSDAEIHILEWLSPGLGSGGDGELSRKMLAKSLEESFALNEEHSLWQAYPGSDSDSFCQVYRTKGLN